MIVVEVASKRRRVFPVLIGHAAVLEEGVWVGMMMVVVVVVWKVMQRTDSDVV